MTTRTYHCDDCAFKVPDGFIDRTAQTLEWSASDGSKMALIVQRERALEVSSFAAYVADQTKDYASKFEGFRIELEDAPASNIRRIAFRCMNDGEVLYHHQAFVGAAPWVFLFTCSAKARDREAADQLVTVALSELRFNELR